MAKRQLIYALMAVLTVSIYILANPVQKIKQPNVLLKNYLIDIDTTTNKVTVQLDGSFTTLSDNICYYISNYSGNRKIYPTGVTSASGDICDIDVKEGYTKVTLGSEISNLNKGNFTYTLVYEYTSAPEATIELVNYPLLINTENFIITSNEEISLKQSADETIFKGVALEDDSYTIDASNLNYKSYLTKYPKLYIERG